MGNLLLDIQPGCFLLINGATVQFQTRTRLLLRSHARFLFGKQVMQPQDATTPARRLYLAVQEAHVGDPVGRSEAMQRGLSAYVEWTASHADNASARESMERAFDLAQDDQCYGALRLISAVMQAEEAPVPEALPDPEPAV